MRIVGHEGEVGGQQRAGVEGGIWDSQREAEGEGAEHGAAGEGHGGRLRRHVGEGEQMDVSSH